VGVELPGLFAAATVQAAPVAVLPLSNRRVLMVCVSPFAGESPVIGATPH